METELCAGNLVFSTPGEELQTLFAQAGALKSVAIIQARDTNRGRSAGAAVTGAPSRLLHRSRSRFYWSVSPADYSAPSRSFDG